MRVVIDNERIPDDDHIVTYLDDGTEVWRTEVIDDADSERDQWEAMLRKVIADEHEDMASRAAVMSRLAEWLGVATSRRVVIATGNCGCIGVELYIDGDEVGYALGVEYAKPVPIERLVEHALDRWQADR